MSFARPVCLLLALVFVPAGDQESAADPPAKKPVVQAFDANGDGKLGRIEKANARPTRAMLRQSRALRRNAAVIRTVK